VAAAAGGGGTVSRTYVYQRGGSRRASTQVRRLVSAAAAAFYYCVCVRESDRQWQWVCRVQLGYAIVDRENDVVNDVLRLYCSATFL